MRREFVCVPFWFALTCFPACLTLDPLAPAQSKRIFSIWALPSIMCNFGTPFVTFWRHLGIIYHACKTCKSKDRKRREMSLNLDFKTGYQKVIFLVVFGVWLWRCARVAPRVPFGAPGWFQGPSQDTKSEPNGTKKKSHSHCKSTKIDKSLELVALKAAWFVSQWLPNFVKIGSQIDTRKCERWQAIIKWM